MTCPLHALKPVAAALAALSLTTLATLPARATSCVALPPSGSIPQEVRQAREDILSYQPENPGGYVRLVEQLAQNRRDFENGIITASEAEQRGGFAVTGTRYLPVLPVLYSNTPAEPINPASLEDLLFAPWRDDSMHSYFVENSYDQFFLEGDVFGFETVDGTDVSYSDFNYGLNGGAAELAFEAVLKADDTTDFSLYDNDGPDGIPNSGDDDGFVDALLIIHPEIGGECSDGDISNIWSHHSYITRTLGLPAVTNDASANGGSIFVDRYIIGSALSCNADGSMIEIGVLAHEYGHALGIPDLYDTHEELSGIGDSQGIGFWGLMGSGCWNTPKSPGHMTSHTKARLGWLDYFDILQDGRVCLPPVETNPVAARVWTNGVYGPEYFLVENRQQIGFDQNLQGPGIVIYHVNDYRYVLMEPFNRVNGYETNKGIDVETPDANIPGHTYEADDLDDAINGNRGDSGDVWCVGGVDNVFNFASSSDNRAMNGDDTGVSVLVTDDCDGDASNWICVDFTVGVPQPVDLCIEDCPGDNCNDIATCEDWWATPNIWIDNEEDGIHDAPSWSIPNKVFFELQNLGPNTASGAEVALYTAPAAMGLEWPQDGDLVGSMTVPVLAPGAVRKDHFVFDYPDHLELDGHWCMGVVLTHPEDLTTSGSAPLTNNVAQVNEQVLVARAGTPVEPVALARGGDCPGEMAQDSKIYILDGPNPLGGERNVIVRIGTPPNFDDLILPAHWQLDILPDQGPFQVNPSVKDSIIVRVSSETAAHGESAHVPLTLWDIGTDEMIGGAALDFSVDCYAPRAASNISVNWIAFPGDSWGEHNVVVRWDDVVDDEQSTPEQVEHYEVYRSVDGGPEFLIDQIIIDGDPGAPGFQWYDSVPTVDCESYAYRVRAIDRAGNVSLYSGTAVLGCGVADVPDEPADGPDASWTDGRRTRALPNPFAETTEIQYRLTQPGEVEVAVFDVTGTRVRLLDADASGAGVHSVRWDGSDDSDRPVPSGIYFYRVVGGDIAEMRKIVRSR